MKKIVTHINPDLDAVTSVWLLKRFLPGWEEAEVGFCPASETLDDQPVDTNPDILHVDTGLGELDHHQFNKYLSAAKLCFDYIKQKRKGEKLSPLDEAALERIVQVATEVDNARDLNWPEVAEDRYDFYFHTIIAGIRGLAGSDEEVITYGLKGLDAIFHQVKKRLDAEEELKKGVEFKTPWGKALGVESGNDNVLWEGEKKGYCLVVRKDPESGGVRIYSRYDTDVDLTEAYNKFRELDPNSDWYLHQSKKLLLNQASVNPNMRPTKLSLEEIIKVLKET